MHCTSLPYTAMRCCAAMCPALGGKPTGKETRKSQTRYAFRLFTVRFAAVPYRTVHLSAFDGKTHRDQACLQAITRYAFRYFPLLSATIHLSTMHMTTLHFYAMPCAAIGGKPTGRSPRRRLNPLCFPVPHTAFHCNSVRFLTLHSMGKPTGKETRKSQTRYAFPFSTTPSSSLRSDALPLVENPPGSSLFLSYHPLCFPIPYNATLAPAVFCHTLPSMGKPTGKEAIANPKPALLSCAPQWISLPFIALRCSAFDGKTHRKGAC